MVYVRYEKKGGALTFILDDEVRTLLEKKMEVEGIAPSSKGFVIKGSPCSVRNRFNPPGLCERDPERRSA